MNGDQTLQTYSKLADLQTAFDAAAIMPTILREDLYRALTSVFCQRNIDRIQILIGVDRATPDDLTRLYSFLEDIPDHIAITVLNPGYSTSQRHGGIHKAYDGGSLRTVLSFLANSPYLTYLDDDNWWHDDHLKELKKVISDYPWAFSHRNYIHHESLDILCQDRLESVGPDEGIYKTKAGGFVDPNCLMLNKMKTDAVLPLWATHLDNDPTKMSGDRLIFDRLRTTPFGDTQQATVNYVLNPKDKLHQFRLDHMPQDVREKYYG